MTREEAIKGLQAVKAECGSHFNEGGAWMAEFIDETIKLLEQEPCEDAISRAEAIKALEYDLSIEADGGLDKYRTVIKDLCNSIYNTQKKAIEDLPSIQPKPKTGQWKLDIDNNRSWDWRRWYCSCCGDWQTHGETRYCPNCGAKMEVNK